MSESTRPCRRCGEPRHWTGSRWRCSRCFNEWQSAWKAKRTPEQRAATQAQQTATRRNWSPEQRAKQNAYAQAWRDANRERHRRVTHEWYQRNLERARQAKRNEYYANPEAFYARNLTRKARLLAALCEHGPRCISAEFLKSVYGEACLYCGDPAEAADHFHPLARGGLHCVENIVPACQPCNSRKSDRDPAEWLASFVG